MSLLPGEVSLGEEATEFFRLRTKQNLWMHKNKVGDWKYQTGYNWKTTET